MSDKETPFLLSEEEDLGASPDESVDEQQSDTSDVERHEAEPSIEEEASGLAEHETGTAAVPDMDRRAAPAVEAVPESETAPAEGVTMQSAEMRDVFSDQYTYPRPKRGEIRTARVIASINDGILVDLGLKREGLIPSYDLQRVGADLADKVSEGDELPVFVVRPEHDQEGRIIVSWYRARQEQDWVEAQKILESGDVWEGEVRGYNRGGLIVPFGKIRGFVPASHVTGISRRMGQAGLQARLAEMVGKTLPLKVLEVNRQKRRLIFSERIAQRQWRVQQREKLLDELQEGDHVHGVVSNICDFGAFVDIGGTDGLVHISELSWSRTKHPSEVVKTGDEVDAYVLRVDKERKRIGLSLRLMQPDPWDSVEQNYSVGQLVTGVITKLTDFGAFAALDDGIEGLIHISELAEVPPRHPSEVVTPDQAVPLIVVKIDSRRRRMGLSLKRVSEEEWFEWEEQRKAAAAPQEVPAAEAPVLESTGEKAPLAEEPQPEAAEETTLPAEGPSVEPPDEILMNVPPPEEVETPPLANHASSSAPPEGIPLEEPPPEENEFA